VPWGQRASHQSQCGAGPFLWGEVQKQEPSTRTCAGTQHVFSVWNGHRIQQLGAPVSTCHISSSFLRENSCGQRVLALRDTPQPRPSQRLWKILRDQPCEVPVNSRSVVQAMASKQRHSSRQQPCTHRNHCSRVDNSVVGVPVVTSNIDDVVRMQHTAPRQRRANRVIAIVMSMPAAVQEPTRVDMHAISWDRQNRTVGFTSQRTHSAPHLQHVDHEACGFS